jgi:hypothetical protein
LGSSQRSDNVQPKGRPQPQELRLSPGELASSLFQDLTEAVIASRRRPTPGAVNKDSEVTPLANSPRRLVSVMAEPASAGAEFGHDQAYSCRVDSTRAEGAEPINAIFRNPAIADSSRSEDRRQARLIMMKDAGFTLLNAEHRASRRLRRAPPRALRSMITTTRSSPSALE